MDTLQETGTIADWGWQVWIYAVTSISLVLYMVFYSHRTYKKFIERFERKNNVRVVARMHYYEVVGPQSWLERLWLELKLMFGFMFIYFSPILLIGLIGWALGVFR